MTDEGDTQLRRWSVISGASILVMAVAAGFAYGFVFPEFYVEGNPAQTSSNIDADIPLFYGGVAGWLVVVVADFLVTYGFYAVLRPGHPTWAKLTGATRLAYTLGLSASVISLATKDVDQFLTLWHLSLFLFFGAHLISAGVAAFHERRIPNILAVLLIVAGVGYLVVEGTSSLTTTTPGWFEPLQSVLAIPMTLGELAFGIWLLVRGGRQAPVETA